MRLSASELFGGGAVVGSRNALAPTVVERLATLVEGVRHGRFYNLDLCVPCG